MGGRALSRGWEERSWEAVAREWGAEAWKSGVGTPWVLELTAEGWDEESYCQPGR